MISLKIDGQKYKVEEGLTILQAAQRNGIHIPTLCHMKGIEDNSSCRVCVVEVEGSRNLQPACVVKATDGMVINTTSEAVLSARRTVINLILSNGEHNCLSCEANGDCRLQDIAYDLGIETPAFIIDNPNKPELDSSSEMIVRDNRKCILCRKCVAACNQVSVNDVLGFGFRGGDTQIICDDDKPMGESSCVQCGECVQACPVGALVDKKSMGKARNWELKKVRTTCPYCGVGCQMDLHMKGDYIVKVTGVEDAEPNKGRLCVKGRYGYDFIYSKERLTTPLIKENGEFREASWDEALNLVASKFKDIIEKHGTDAVAGISSARSINEDSYYMQKLFRAVFQSRNIDHCARSCHAPTVAGLMTSFGAGGMTNSFAEFSKAKLIFCTGTNMVEAHPVAATFVKNAVKNGARLIVADPRRHKLADFAEIYAPIKIGSDVGFLNGLMNVIITEDLYDKEFVKNNCEDFESFKAKVLEYTPEKASEISGVPKEQIIQIARELAAAKPAMLIYTLGLTEHTCGKNNVMSVANLQMLLGSVGKECAGVNPLRGQNNVQGACDMAALPNILPGYQKFTDKDAVEKFAKAWGVKSIPNTLGLMIPEMIDALPSKKVRGLWIFGLNAVNTEPDIRRVEECMEQGEFIVCNEIFHNETTKFADVVFPAAAWCEDDGTFTNSERRVNRIRAIKKAPGVAKPNWWVFKEVAKCLGHDWPSNSAQEIWDNEISVLCPGFAGIKYSRIEKDGFQWPCLDEKHTGTPVLHSDGKFTRGKGLFMALDWTPPAEVADKKYPFVLSTGRRLYHYHTRTQTGRCEGLDRLLPEEYVDISEVDAQRLGIKDGEMVKVKSRRNEVEVRAKVSDRIQPGTVWMAFHFRKGNANWLTNQAYDPETKTAEYKACAVNVEKI